MICAVFLETMPGETRSGVSPRSAYLNKISQYHSDKVSHLGLKLRDVAERESRRINAAYEYLAKQYRKS